MAVDKLVDSTQLNSDLTSVANAIRTKGGTSAQLAFPSDFVTAIGALPSGGNTNLYNIIARTFTGVFTDNTIKTIGTQGFSYNTGLTSLNCPNLETIGEGGLRNTGVTSLNLPSLENLIGTYSVAYNSSLITFVAPNFNMSTTPTHTFYNDSNLEAVDLGGTSVRIGNEVFHACTKMETLVIRQNSVATLATTGAFNQSPFASGGTGGTLYVPEDLISSYQSASNWSTILGYTNNQIKKIEGTAYETAYVDGSPIS